MRDGPPMAASHGDPSQQQTTNLLKEIFSLRSRLKELEDDTKSTFSDAQYGGGMHSGRENDLINLLKKDLAKVENEKASIEKEFMNQITSLAQDNKRKQDDLNWQLKRSEEANLMLNEMLLAKGNSSEEASRLQRLLEDERRKHNTEVMRMNQNIISSDQEIVALRREMDVLQEEFALVETDREALAQEVEILRVDADNERRKTESYKLQLSDEQARSRELQDSIAKKDAWINSTREELGEMNDTIIDLEKTKDRFQVEAMELRAELEKATEETTLANEKVALIEATHAHLEKELDRLRTVSDENTTENDNLNDRIRELTTAAENLVSREAVVSLEDSVAKLEGELAVAKKQLEEKEEALDEASNTLNEERRQKKRLKADLVKAKNLSPKKPSDEDKSIIEKQTSEIELLKKQNKILKDELRTIQMNSEHESPTERSTASTKASTQSRELLSGIPAPPLSPPPVVSANGSECSPRTPVSGIVANIEKRMAGSSAANSVVSEEVTNDQLLAEKKIAADLRAELDSEQAKISGLKHEISTLLAFKEASTGLEDQLSKIRAEINRLQSKIDELEQTNASLEVQLENERREVDELDAHLNTHLQEKEEMARRISEDTQEIQRLRSELQASNEQLSIQDEKKEASINGEELLHLRNQISKLQLDLDKAHFELRESRNKNESLKMSLMNEQNATMDAIKKAEEAGRLLESIQQDDDDSKSEKDSLKAELVKTQVEKADLDMEYMSRIKNLETDLESMEIRAQRALDEKDKQIDELKDTLAKKEDDISRMENEKAQLCSSMLGASSHRKDEIDDLQNELYDMTNRAATQAREIQSLKGRIEDLQVSKKDMESRRDEEIYQLKEQLEDLRRRRGVENDSSVDVPRVQAENQRLRDVVRNLKMQKQSLQERLDSLVAKKSKSKSSQALRERNATLKQEVDKLSKRLKKMESSITRFAI